MELSGNDINLLHAFFGDVALKCVTIRLSFAKGLLTVSRDMDMIMEFYYPPNFGAVLASMKFALRGILKLRIHIVTVDNVERSLSICMNDRRVLIFEE